MMAVQCSVCGSENVRPSHFRWKDLAYLLVLRSAVRCRYCRTRFYVSIFRILGVRRRARERSASEKYRTRTSRTDLNRQRKNIS